MRLLTSTAALLVLACAVRLYRAGNALGRAGDALLANSRRRR